MNSITPQSTRLSSGIQLVASAIVVAVANITTNQLSGRVSQSGAIAILLVLVIIISKLLETIAKNLFDSSTVFRRLVLGDDFIEGCWLHRVYDNANPGQIASFAIIYLTCGNNSINVNGKAYNMDGSFLASFSTAATVYQNGKLRGIYDGLKTTAPSGDVIGYSEYSFVKSKSKGIPLMWSGFLYDTHLGIKHLTQGTKIINKRTLELLKRDQGISQIVAFLAKSSDQNRKVYDDNIISSETTGVLHYMKKIRHQKRLDIAEVLINRCLEIKPNIGADVPKLLSIGCNDGSFESRFVKKSISVYGIDGDPSAINSATLKGVQAIVGDFSQNLPYQPGMFDVIFAGEVIEHVFDVDKFLDELARVLKPGGYLIITTPNLARLSDRFRFLVGISPKHVAPTHSYLKFHIHPFTLASLRNALTETGFQVISCHTNCVRLFGVYDSYLIGKAFPSLGNSLIVAARR